LSKDHEAALRPSGDVDALAPKPNAAWKETGAANLLGHFYDAVRILFPRLKLKEKLANGMSVVKLFRLGQHISLLSKKLIAAQGVLAAIVLCTSAMTGQFNRLANNILATSAELCIAGTDEFAE